MSNSCNSEIARGIDLQELGDIAGAEDPVDIRKFLRLVSGEVRREHAVRRTSPPQQLAGGAWRRLPAAARGLPGEHLLTHQVLLALSSSLMLS